MKALILNSGTGSRMGDITKTMPKCMMALYNGETILNRQLRLLKKTGINDIVITTGKFESEIQKAVPKATLINNPHYADSNYIYSIYFAREVLDDDILLLHGDLVFDLNVLKSILSFGEACVVTQPGAPLSKKDFKAEISDGKVVRIGVDVWCSAVACQPLYYLKYAEWKQWLNCIIKLVERGEVTCYAENALPKGLLSACNITSFCREIDTLEDLKETNAVLKGYENNEDSFHEF